INVLKRTIRLIPMHQIIDEIIASTKNRIPFDSNPIKKRITSRDFKKSIKDKKQKGLIPLISEIKPSSPTRFFRNVSPQEAADIAAVSYTHLTLPTILLCVDLGG